MNLSTTPNVTFSPDLSTSLLFDAAQSWWITDRIFQARFDVVDAGVNVPNVSVHVTGARDATGLRYEQLAYDGPAGFSIDTLDPAPPRTAVTSAIPDLKLVTDPDVGRMLSLRITYDAAMNTNRNPAVTLSPDAATTLSYDAAQSWWVSSTTFVARFGVADADAVVPVVTVGVTGAYDAAGNIQAPYSAGRLRHRHAQPAHAGDRAQRHAEPDGAHAQQRGDGDAGGADRL